MQQRARRPLRRVGGRHRDRAAARARLRPARDETARRRSRASRPRSRSTGSASAAPATRPRRSSASAATATSRSRCCRASTGSSRCSRSGRARATSSASTSCAPLEREPLAAEVLAGRNRPRAGEPQLTALAEQALAEADEGRARSVSSKRLGLALQASLLAPARPRRSRARFSASRLGGTVDSPTAPSRKGLIWRSIIDRHKSTQGTGA